VDRRGAWWILAATAAAALAGNYKPQFVPLAGIFVPFFAVGIVFARGTDGLIASIGPRKRTFAILLTLAIIGCYFVALRNSILYGNPLYPIHLRIFGRSLPGVHINDLYPLPAYLAHAPQQIRWFLSIIEYHALDFRPVPYTLGQGDVPATADSANMGGYFSFYVFFNLWLFFTSAWRKGVRHRWLALVFVVGSAAIASTPSSQSLRFFSFWMLYLVAMNFAYLWVWNGTDFVGRRYFTAVSVSAFLFVVAVTGGTYFLNHGRSLNGLIADFKINERFVSKFEDGKRYCLINWNQLGVLAAAPLHPGRSYFTIYGRSPEECATNNATPVDFSAP
jgi:hypothetical protein